MYIGRKYLVVKFDGACDNGRLYSPMGIGVALFIDNIKSLGLFFYGGLGTSNIAEWKGLREAFRASLKLIYDNPLDRFSITILGDSQLIVRQFSGAYKIKDNSFIELYSECKELESALKKQCDTYGHVYRGVDWIPRTQNGDADDLSKKGRKEIYD